MTDWVNQVATVKVTDPRNGTVTYAYDGGRNFRLVYEEDQTSRSRRSTSTTPADSRRR